MQIPCGSGGAAIRLAREGILTADLSLADVPRSTVGAELARDGGLTAGLYLDGVHIRFCGNGRLGFRF